MALVVIEGIALVWEVGVSYSVSFAGVRMTNRVKVSCPDCGKSRVLTLDRTYYRNGFHNESETREKYRDQLKNESERLQVSGKVCLTCERKRKGYTLDKLPDGDYNITAYPSGEHIALAQRVKHGGWVKWKCGKVNAESLDDLVERLEREPKRTPPTPKDDGGHQWRVN